MLTIHFSSSTGNRERWVFRSAGSSDNRRFSGTGSRLNRLFRTCFQSLRAHLVDLVVLGGTMPLARCESC